jgi:aryl-alcohol dehydrogenase-like predicted oxidoreductase
MDYRRLAGTDLDVSVLCFGPMRSAARTPRADDRSQAGERALRTALDSGVNFVHSSYEYGVRWMMNGVLRDHPKRHDIHHVIKLPGPDWKDGNRFDAAKFRMRVEEALTDLAAERIAVLQWMWRTDPNDDDNRVKVLPMIVDDVTAAFETLRDEGKVGFLSTFPYTSAAAKAAIDTDAFSGLIGFYNPIEMEMQPLFAELAEKNMGFLCIRPLYQGILTDGRDSLDALPDGHHLKKPENAPEFAKRRAVVSAFAEEIGDSTTRFALRFPLLSESVASVITGLNTEAQVRHAIDCLSGVTPRPDLTARALRLWQQDLVRLDGRMVCSPVAAGVAA